MKLSVSSTELQRSLNNISGVIPSKSTLPILENILLELAGDELTLTATDLEIFMSVNVAVKGSQDGRIAIPAKKLLETVRALPETTVVLVAETGSNKVEMKTDSGVYKLTGEASENYPSVPAFKDFADLQIDNEMLRRLITKTSFAVSSDELRPAMTGILLQVKPTEIRAVSTDGHRLVKFTHSGIKSKNPEKEIIVSAKALNLVAKCITDAPTKISLSDTQARFTLGNITLVSRMIDEKYPNYESVLPLDNEKKLTVDKNELLASVRRTALYASSTTHLVRFSLSKNSMAVSAEDVDFGSEAKESLKCAYSSESMEIGFNSYYVVDILSHLDTDEAVFMFSSSSRAAIVKPAQQREGEDVVMLVMPVRLNG